MMDYLEIGLVLGIITAVVLLYLTLKNRWLSDSTVAIYEWWDGRYEDTYDVLIDMFMLSLLFVAITLTVMLTYALALPLILIWYIIRYIRNKHVQTLKKP